MINYEMALSEIEMYKKAHESLSENLTHANKKTQQFKAERDTLIDDLSWYKAKVSRLEQIREIKDSALKGADIKIKTLEQENEKLQGRLDEFLEHDYDNQKLYKEMERENKKLVCTLRNKEDVIDWNFLKISGLKEDIEKYKRGTSNLINENYLKHDLLSEISQHIGNKPSSSTYKYFREKLNALEIKEGE